jgi:hypothetical protein
MSGREAMLSCSRPSNNTSYAPSDNTEIPLLRQVGNRSEIGQRQTPPVGVRRVDIDRPRFRRDQPPYLVGSGASPSIRISTARAPRERPDVVRRRRYSGSGTRIRHRPSRPWQGDKTPCIRRS